MTAGGTGVGGGITSPPTAEGARRAALAGVAFAALMLVNFALLAGMPDAGSSDSEYSDFYRNGDTWRVLLAAFYVVPFAGIAFIWFLAALRHRAVHLEGGTEDALLATAQLVSGVLFIAMTFAGAAAGAASSASIELSGAPLEATAPIRQLTAASEAFITVFAIRSAAVFILTGTTRARRSGMFPRWFTAPSLFIALVLLLATTSYRPVVLLFPLWVAVASLFVLRRVPPTTPTTS
jgi:hypothetical protein